MSHYNTLSFVLNCIALGWFALFAGVWKSEGWPNIFIKLGLTGSAAFAAVVVAMGFLS